MTHIDSNPCRVCGCPAVPRAIELAAQMLEKWHADPPPGCRHLADAAEGLRIALPGMVMDVADGSAHDKGPCGGLAASLQAPMADVVESHERRLVERAVDLCASLLDRMATERAGDAGDPDGMDALREAADRLRQQGTMPSIVERATNPLNPSR